MPENAPTSNLLDKFTAALKRTPGNLAGGAVDVSNMVLGLVTGKGLGGFVDKPIGGSKQLNELAGLPEPTSTGQALAESALGMINPGAALKGAGLAAAGIMIPVSKSGMKLSEILEAQKLIKAGDIDKAYAKHKVYEDPFTQELLKVIPDTSSTINNPAFRITPFASNQGPKVLTVHAPTASTHAKLSDILSHSELYARMPELKDISVAANKGFNIPEMGQAAYYGSTNSMLLGGELSVNAMQSKVLHELQHGVQSATGMAPGGSPRQFIPDNARLNTARANVEKYGRESGTLETSMAPLNAIDKKAFDMYENLPGETMARLVEHQFTTGDYSTHPLTLMKQLGMPTKAENFTDPAAKLEITPEVQKILDIFAPVTGEPPKMLK